MSPTVSCRNNGVITSQTIPQNNIRSTTSKYLLSVLFENTKRKLHNAANPKLPTKSLKYPLKNLSIDKELLEKQNTLFSKQTTNDKENRIASMTLRIIRKLPESRRLLLLQRQLP